MITTDEILRDQLIFSIRDGKNHVKVNSEMSPIQHAPVAVRAGLKEELDRMTEQEIIAPVTAPTPWVSSVVVVPKPN